MVVDEVDVWGVVHPAKVITIDKIAAINNNFRFIFITHDRFGGHDVCPFYCLYQFYWHVDS